MRPNTGSSPFQQVVHSLGRAVGEPRHVEGADGLEPVRKGTHKRPDLRGRRALLAVVDDVAQEVGCLEGVFGLVEPDHRLFHGVGEGDLPVGVAERQEPLETLLQLSVFGGLVDDEELSRLVERVPCPAPVPEALLLDSAAHLVDTEDGVAHDVEAVDHPRRLRGHDLEHRVVGLGHVQAAVVEAVFHVVGLGAQPAGDLHKVPGREHVDQGVVDHVAVRRRPGLLLVGPRADKERLVEPDGRRGFQAFGVGGQEGRPVDAHRRVDGVPAAAELSCEVTDGQAAADLVHHPLGRPRREPAADRSDPVVPQGEGAHRAALVGADEPVLLQRSRIGTPPKGRST